MPQLADLILALLVVEGAGLLLLWRLRGVGVPPAPLLCFLGAGAALALALRAALSGAGPGAVAFWAVLSLPLHLAWIALAWKRAERREQCPGREQEEERR
ncbi:MAG: hypothetical protein RMK64_03340 [Rhodovarius sp.]|nr:hypothetical protein [Rhodovarius sp.]MCX7933188.1 hypothetical protein [Rhodovarius sp.]MDW8313983.1 hypothetical protein [Rhodovarius sp.]